MSGALACYLEGTNGNLLSCVLGDLVGAAGGEGLFGLLVGGTMILTLYIAGRGDLATPTVITIMFGSLMVPLLPASYAGIAYNIVIVGIAAAVMAVAHRYILSGASA